MSRSVYRRAQISSLSSDFSWVDRERQVSFGEDNTVSECGEEKSGRDKVTKEMFSVCQG